MSGNFSSIKLDNATLSLFQNGTTSNVISIIYMIVTAINLLGNGLSMWILLFKTFPKTPSIIFMINLTFTDLALGSALPFQIAYQLRGYDWNLGASMCRYCLRVQGDCNEAGCVIRDVFKLSTCLSGLVLVSKATGSWVKQCVILSFDSPF